MKRKKITVWLFLFAGALYGVAGLRDTFAPGFFNISPHVPTTADIALNFALASVFLVLSASFSMTGKQKEQDKN